MNPSNFFFRLGLSDTYSGLLALFRDKPFSAIGLSYNVKGKNYFILHGILEHCPIAVVSYNDLIAHPLISKMEIYPFAEEKNTSDLITQAILSIPLGSKGISYFHSFFRTLDQEGTISEEGLPKCKLLKPMQEARVKREDLKPAREADLRNKGKVLELFQEDSQKVKGSMDLLFSSLSQDSTFIDLSEVKKAFNGLAEQLGYSKRMDLEEYVLDVSSLYEDDKKKIFTQEVDLSLLSGSELNNLLLYADSEKNSEEFAKKILKEIYRRQK